MEEEKKKLLILLVVDLTVFLVGAAVLILIRQYAGLVIVVPLGIMQAVRLLRQFKKLKK